jgi:hypothetical protein
MKKRNEAKYIKQSIKDPKTINESVNKAIKTYRGCNSGEKNFNIRKKSGYY